MNAGDQLAARSSVLFVYKVSDFVEADDQFRSQLLSWLVPACVIGLAHALKLEDVELTLEMNEAVRAVQSAIGHKLRRFEEAN